MTLGPRIFWLSELILRDRISKSDLQKQDQIPSDL